VATEFTGLADLLPEPLLLITLEGVITAVNSATRKHFPGTIDVGMNLSEVATPPADALLGFLRSCARTRHFLPGALSLPDDNGKHESFRAEGALYRARSAGAPALILLRLSPRRTAMSRFIALSTTIAQLNEELLRRRRYEAALHEQHEQLRVTLASIGDAVIATDLQTNITHINPSAEQLTGWSAAEAIGRPLANVFRIINEQTRAPADNPVTQAIARGVVVGLANHTLLIRKDGVEVSIADSAAPIRSSENRPIGVVLVFRDVTEQRQTQRELQTRAQQLEEADRRKDEYLAMLAHELRNPLAALSNAVQVSRLAKVSSDQRQAMLDIMSRQIGHVSHLVSGLLDVARVTHGKIDLQTELLDVRTIVQRAVELSRPVIDARNHALRMSLPLKAVEVNGDPVRLTQVISNLLDNAAKYTPPGGTIELICETEPTSSKVTVRDNGIGIPTDLLPRVFDLFQQGDTSSERVHSGLGIGLTLVRTLVALHGGSVHVHSAEGRGSEFQVVLPTAHARGSPT
jgi:PAS domain S-box-containing protein